MNPCSGNLKNILYKYLMENFTGSMTEETLLGLDLPQRGFDLNNMYYCQVMYTNMFKTEVMWMERC